MCLDQYARLISARESSKQEARKLMLRGHGSHLIIKTKAKLLDNHVKSSQLQLHMPHSRTFAGRWDGYIFCVRAWGLARYYLYDRKNTKF